MNKNNNNISKAARARKARTTTQKRIRKREIKLRKSNQILAKNTNSRRVTASQVVPSNSG